MAATRRLLRVAAAIRAGVSGALRDRGAIRGTGRPGKWSASSHQPPAARTRASVRGKTTAALETSQRSASTAGAIGTRPPYGFCGGFGAAPRVVRAELGRPLWAWHPVGRRAGAARGSKAARRVDGGEWAAIPAAPPPGPRRQAHEARGAAAPAPPQRPVLARATHGMRGPAWRSVSRPDGWRALLRFGQAVNAPRGGCKTTVRAFQPRGVPSTLLVREMLLLGDGAPAACTRSEARVEGVRRSRASVLRWIAPRAAGARDLTSGGGQCTGCEGTGNGAGLGRGRTVTRCRRLQLAAMWM
jgi:hypothetical protein